MKHTSGPWHIVEHSWSDTGIFAEPVAGNPRRVATLELPGEYEEDTEESHEQCEADQVQQKANALLIAASPDLYEACEVGFTALWAIKTRLSEPRTEAEKTAMDELQRRMDILGSALRKARGQ